MNQQPKFLLTTCQVGAEAALKKEMARRWPAFRFAYSRPGFLTFKLPPDHTLADDFDLESVFARAYAFSLGKASGEDVGDLARQTWAIWGDRPIDRVHVWQRDAAAPGDHGFEPSITPAAVEATEAIRRECPWPDRLEASRFDLRQTARTGERVLDCVLVEPNQWWVGLHKTKSFASRWPGGMISLELPADAVSRAWLKMEEALRWSQLPIPPGARCAEIGSAPGGSCQALLMHGHSVIGIDPAVMAPGPFGKPAVYACSQPRQPSAAARVPQSPVADG